MTIVILSRTFPPVLGYALNALIFLYREVLKQEVEGISAMRARTEKRLPVVLTREETAKLLEPMRGAAGLACRLLYGCGLRIAEVMRLRVKDVDVGGGKLEVRGGKGDKDCLSSLLRLLRPAGRLPGGCLAPGPWRSAGC